MIFKIWARLMTCLFFILNPAQSSILKDDIVSVGEESFSYSYVCKKTFKKDFPLIEVKDILTLDCMSKEVKTYNFCLKELEASPYYIRGVIDVAGKKVICKKGKSVTMKVTCDTPGVDCKDSELACFNLKQKYAARLNLNHHSSFEEKSIKVLNCYFGEKTALKLPSNI